MDYVYRDTVHPWRFTERSNDEKRFLMTYEFIPLLPLISFLILGLFGHWIKDNAHLVAVPAVVVSWLLSVLVFFDVAGGHQTSFPSTPGSHPVLSIFTSGSPSTG